MRLYSPPAALLPKGDKFTVELAGAKILLAMTEEKDFINISSVFDELSLGEFWRDNPAIADQIEKINIKHEDSDALYDPNVLAEKVTTTLDRIISRGLLLLGAASFEGNAFETTVFDEIELNIKDQDRLMNLYKKTRLEESFPNVKKGISGTNEFVEINWFGEASKFFTLADKKDLSDIAASIYPYKGSVTGIVAVAQGAANFIILTDSILKEETEAEIHIDKYILNQMFNLIHKNVLAAPISWFKIELGIAGLEYLDGWDEIKDFPQIRDAIDRYQKYHRDLITQKEEKSIEKILDEDLGNPIDINSLTVEEIEDDVSEMMRVLNTLNELQMDSVEESILIDPPKLLVAHHKRNSAPIGGAMSLLSIDVGQNISCIADLRESVSWADYLCDDESRQLDVGAFDVISEDENFLELENGLELKDKYAQAFQKIVRGSEAFLGVLELESNGFEFSLFHELQFKEEDMKKIQQYYRERIEFGNFPTLIDRRIKIVWKGRGKRIFTFPNCFPSILDIAETLQNDPVYHNKYLAGIVCVDSRSTYFYTLVDNIDDEDKSFDRRTLKLLYQDLQEQKVVLLSWFKIQLGLKSLEAHPLWKDAKHYDSLLIVIENYKTYLQNLIEQKTKEEPYRIY